MQCNYDDNRYNNGCNCSRREDMLNKIQAYDFSIIDLELYCDTHPEDLRAIAMHNQCCKAKKNLADQYQKIYGPLTVDYPCNKWRWIEGWPWEEGGY